MTAPLKHSDPITVDVALGARAYDIVIGRDVLGSLGARVAALRPGARTAIVTDRNVAKHWLEKTEASLAQAGIATSRIVVEEGEGSKTYAGLERVSEALIAARIERNDLVVALGGGVVGDLAGFAAAILRRGVDFVQVPTSLLAQVDSSVGGKTGINSPQGKNLLGAFHQPVLVIADTSVLDTLSPRQFRAGYAEVAKYGVLGDEGFFARYAKILKLEVTRLEREIAQHTYSPRVQEDYMSGIRSGVNGTPTFFINGVRYDGYPEFGPLISALETA